jgi:dCMP deaminase
MWANRFLDLARLVASWSKDPRTKVGAVAVLDKRTRETGYNGLPQGVLDLPERMLPPVKYIWTAHAEANMVATAARPRLAGTTVYVTHPCCSECAKLLIQAGVARVCIGAGETVMQNDPERQEGFEAAMTMFREKGVEVEFAAAG